MSSRVQTWPKPSDFFGGKNPQHAFLRKGSKVVGPVSQICGTLKNPCDYMEVESQGEILSAISRLSFPPSLTEGSALEQFVALQRATMLIGTAWVPPGVDGAPERRTKGPCNTGRSAYGATRSHANISIYLPHS
jgi:hypothetical protein